MGDNRELEATRDFDPGADDSIFDAAPDLVVASLLQFPEQIGRYQIKGVLGKGGFGLVYLAHDGLLGRAVAVKVPHRKLVDRPEYAEAYLNEARIVASLDHPHIVPVYDFGCTEQLPCFIVSKYIDGMDLASRLRQSRLTIKEATELTVVVAEALHHAHKQGLVHRDVKPGNILLDKQGKPYVSDFGLALREGQFEPDRDRLYGTPHYMSPEQARGEGHLVDGRADVFTLGVVLYEILTGIRPFSGPTLRDVLEAVVSHEPRPLRQRNELIPRELQRIVMQAMSKRASERYSSAQDFADDLRDFLKSDIAAIVPETLSTISTSQASPAQPTPESHTGNSASTSLVIVPKGLQAFDASDRDFFLGLVPGPHDREGLPQSLKFWKTRIEAVSHPLRVGVVYGPSGCGKSSLIRAGLLPKLAASVREVVITTTAKLTEKRLLDELKPLFQQPPGNLVDALQRLRRNASMGRRILIVFDQFEQWLHANHASADSELVQALRQCDGEHVACLLIVRDDFWMSVHRFFRELDIRLAERENCAAVDLFDMRHARRVLHAFGHAYGHLPERTEQLSADQHQFLDQVIAELAEDDHVICVRLALFSQMIRNRSWIPETLTAIGGARGVGIRFLEDTFGPTSAPLAYRAHQVAICEMLRALLPPPGTDIKACTRTVNELVRVAEYDVHSEDFRQVLEILEHETRLLTPVDSPQPTTDATSFNVTDDSGGYQLTHDYLVPSIREWLTRKQRESWRGRCELRLSERASLWNSRRERKQLPSLSETVQITLGTSSTNWTVPQAQMMRQAQRWHGQRALVFLLILTCLSIGAAVWNHGATLALRQHSADAIVDQLLVADIGNVTPVLREMDSTRDLWTARLRLMADQVDELPDNRLRAELALVSRDRERLGGLLKRVLEADSETVRVVREWLATEARPTLDDLSKLIETSTQSNPARLRIAALLAEFAPQSEELWREITGPVATTLVADFSLDTNSWADLLMPVRARLEPELASHFRNAMLTSTQRLNAAQLLAKMGSTELLCRLVPDADTTQFSQLMRPLSRDREPAIKLLQAALDPKPPAGEIQNRLQHVGRQRNIAVALMLLGRDELVWPLLTASSDASLRTEMIVTMRKYGVSLEALMRGEEVVRDPIARQAIWLSLAPSGADISSQDKSDMTRLIAARWQRVSNQSERAGIIWLAQKLGVSETLRTAAAQELPQGCNWSINSQNQSFLKIRGPVEFLMGSPESESRRDGNERQHLRRIDRDFAIGVYEVAAEQFTRFRPNYAPDPQVCPNSSCPAIAISWLEAAKYCRWLSEQEGIPEDQMCYPPADQIQSDMEFYPDLLSRTGYRLPTEAEWEYACRAGVADTYFFGEDGKQLSEFAWWVGNSNERTWAVGTIFPNAFGLFDMQGNVQEWCQDAPDVYPEAMNEKPVSGSAAELRGIQGVDRVLRGGSYRMPNRNFRSSHRFRFASHVTFSILGFRLARTLRAG